MGDWNSDKDCCAGCNRFDFGEVHHIPQCPAYPESMSRMYDEAKAKLTTQEEELKRLRGFVEAVKWDAKNGHDIGPRRVETLLTEHRLKTDE